MFACTCVICHSRTYHSGNVVVALLYRLHAALDNSLSFCRGMGYEVLVEDASDSSEGVKQRRRACYGGNFPGLGFRAVA